MTDEKLKRLTQLAAVLGGIVTAASMIFGVMTYRRGVHEQRQVLAVGILQEYLKLSVDRPELASRTPDQPVDAKYIWFATHALFTAETLWTLVGRDEKWENTIEFVLRNHRDYLRQGAVGCEAYQTGFVEYLKGQFPEFRCGQ